MPLAYQVRAENLDELGVVESDRELFASAVKVFPMLDPATLTEGQSGYFGSYIQFVCHPTRVNAPPKETFQSASNFIARRYLVPVVSTRRAEKMAQVP